LSNKLNGENPDAKMGSWGRLGGLREAMIFANADERLLNDTSGYLLRGVPVVRPNQVWRAGIS
jgi:hypothetical protein